MARHLVGTSGWSYANWRGVFYPERLKQRDWLGYYAERLPTVEINASFYRLPQASMLEGFAERTPDGFVFAVKAWRAITHYRRLAEAHDLLATFLERAGALGDKCGPILFQLPPRFAADVPRLEAFLEGLPEGRRYTFEFRDPDWHQDAVYDLLARFGCAFCPFDLAGLQGPRMVTADFVYVRLHGEHARYRGAYAESTLRDWASWLQARLREGRDVYVYFDNTDDAAHAVEDAGRLRALLVS